MTLLLAGPDCGTFGEDRYTDMCEQQAHAGIGVLVVGAVILLAVLGLRYWWRERAGETRRTP